MVNKKMITTKKITKSELTNSLKTISDIKPTTITPVTTKNLNEVLNILKKLLTGSTSITLIVIKN